LVVYHGSKAKFDVFELNKANRIGASEGYGFYFTDNKNIAEGYRSNSGDLFEVYLSIKNPLNKDAKPFNNTELSKIIKAAVANEIKENKGDIADYKDTFLSNIADTYSTNFNNSIKEAVKMLSENDSAIDQIAELANIMGSENIAMRSVTDATGYDGIYVKDFQGGEGDVYLAWYPEQIKSATGNKGTFDPENPSILFKKEDDPGQEEIKKKLGPRRYLSGDEIQREILQDKMLAVKKFQDEVKRLGGIVTDETDAYHQENHSASIGMEKMNQAEEKYVKPLLDTVMKIAKETKTDFIQVQKYMKAKHAPERNATKRVENKDTEPKVYAGSIDGNLLTDEYANQYVKNFESKVDPKDIEKLWKQLNALTETNLKMLFDYGNISKDSYNHLKNMWKYYVPLRGWEDNMTEVFKYQNEDIGNNSLNLLKKAKGRTSESDDPLPYLSSMLYSTIAWGEKNAYKQSMLNLVDENQKLLKGKVEAKDTYYVKTGVMDENGREEIKETLVRPDQKLFDEGKVSKKRFTGNLSLRPREASIQHEVPVMIGGEKVVLVFNDELVEVANALNHNNAWAIPDEVTRIFQASVGKVTRTLGMLATSKNPAFLVPNMTRDVAYAWLANSIKEGAGIDFAMNLPHAMGAITTNYFGKPDINNKYDLLYKQWKDNGGPTGYLHSQGIDELKNDIEKIYKRYTGTNSYLDKTLQLKAIKKAGELFNALAAVSEEVSRFATFLTSVGNGKSVFQAVTDSKEVTTNFNTKGLSSAFIGSNYMFFNASVQGANNALGLMGIGHKYDFDNKKNKNSRAKKMMAVGASFMALGFFNAMICKLVGGKDDQDDTLYYDKINPYVKHNNLIIPAGKGHHWSIPMPFFFRAFFGAGAAAHDVMTGSIEAGNAIGTSIGEFANAFVPIDISAFTTKKGEVSVRPLIPSYTTGIYDVLTNQDFAGHMIAREAFSKELENLIPDSQLGMKSVNPMIKFTTDLWFKCWGGDPSIQSKGYISGGEQHIVPGFADINPSKAEYLLEYYTGGLGKFFNQTFKTTKELISAGVKTAKGEPDPFEDFSINDIPIANRFYRDVYGDENMKQFAKLREETATYMNLYKQFKKPANIDKFETLLTPDNMSLMLKYKMFDALNSREKDIESSEKTILDLTADIIQAENNKQSSVDLKKERADRIKEFMDIMKEVGIKK
jgi:hypothetical protein